MDRKSKILYIFLSLDCHGKQGQLDNRQEFRFLRFRLTFGYMLNTLSIRIFYHGILFYKITILSVNFYPGIDVSCIFKDCSGIMHLGVLCECEAASQR